jgi:hypothetical protein
MGARIPKQFITLGIKELSKDKFNQITNSYGFIKPNGGLWASPYTPRNKYISAWHGWCASEMSSWITNDSVIFKLKDDAKIYRINKQKDLKDLITMFGQQPSLFSDSEFQFQILPDYERIAKHIDVIYLTETGEWKTRMPIKDHAYNLYGWDCKSILVLNFECIKKWRYKKLDIVR